MTAAINKISEESRSILTYSYNYKTIGIAQNDKIKVNSKITLDTLITAIQEGINEFSSTTLDLQTQLNSIMYPTQNNVRFTYPVKVTLVPWEHSGILAYSLPSTYVQSEFENGFKEMFKEGNFELAATYLANINDSVLRKQLIQACITGAINANKGGVLQLACTYYALEIPNSPQIETVFGKKIADIVRNCGLGENSGNFNLLSEKKLIYISNDLGFDKKFVAVRSTPRDSAAHFKLELTGKYRWRIFNPSFNFMLYRPERFEKKKNGIKACKNPDPNTNQFIIAPCLKNGADFVNNGKGVRFKFFERSSGKEMYESKKEKTIEIPAYPLIGLRNPDDKRYPGNAVFKVKLISL